MRLMNMAMHLSVCLTTLHLSLTLTHIILLFDRREGQSWD